MPKIAMIGAGSMVFCKTLAMDILATDALQESALCLMSRTRPKLDRMKAFLARVIRDLAGAERSAPPFAVRLVGGVQPCTRRAVGIACNRRRTTHAVSRLLPIRAASAPRRSCGKCRTA